MNILHQFVYLISTYQEWILPQASEANNIHFQHFSENNSFCVISHRCLLDCIMPGSHHRWGKNNYLTFPSHLSNGINLHFSAVHTILLLGILWGLSTDVITPTYDTLFTNNVCIHKYVISTHKVCIHCIVIFNTLNVNGYDIMQIINAKCENFN